MADIIPNINALLEWTDSTNEWTNCDHIQWIPQEGGIKIQYSFLRPNTTAEIHRAEIKIVDADIV